MVMAKEKIKAAQVKQKHYYDLKRYKAGVYALGSQVLLKDHTRKKRKGGKLQFRWLGPFSVTKQLRKGLYVITDVKKGTKKRVNGIHLAPFHKSQFNPNQSRSPQCSQPFSPHHSPSTSPSTSQSISSRCSSSPHHSHFYSPHCSPSSMQHHFRSFSPHRSRSPSPLHWRSTDKSIQSVYTHKKYECTLTFK